jgi:hypothetical protein
MLFQQTSYGEQQILIFSEMDEKQNRALITQ